MPTVTVDLDDLDSLIFATAAIKDIDRALDFAKRDPFVAPHLDRKDAHNRVAEAARHARRSLNNGETVIAWDEPLSDSEADALKEVLFAEHTSRRNGTPPYLVIEGDLKAPNRGEKLGVYDRLAAKGAVIMGQLAAGVVWAGADRPDLIARPGYAVKMTPRGRAKHEEWEARRVIEAPAKTKET